jgi:hypothetical protein
MPLLEVPNYCQNFRTHYREGTGRTGTGAEGKPWNRKAFLDAYGAALTQLASAGAVVSDRTLRDWLNEAKTVCPQRNQIDIIIHVFFADASSEDRDAFHDSWVAAQAETYKPRNPTPPAPRPYDPLDDRPSTEDWAISAQDVEQGLASLDVHAPPKHNDPDLFHLRASLSLAEWADEVEGLGVKMQLRDAYLRPIERNCQIESKNDPENAAWTGRVLKIIGPRNVPDQPLSGDALSHDLIATMRRTSVDQAPSMTMELRSRQLDLMVTPENPPPDLTELRKKLLQRFIQTLSQTEGDSHVTWCRASLIGRPTQ